MTSHDLPIEEVERLLTKDRAEFCLRLALAGKATPIHLNSWLAEHFTAILLERWTRARP